MDPAVVDLAAPLPRRRAVRPRRILAAAVVIAATAVTGCGGGTGTGSATISQADAPAQSSWVTVTPPATGAVPAVTWNLLLPPGPLDPAIADNYGESTILANLCESLSLQRPDFTIAPGLATLAVSDGGKRLAYNIDPRARFWDGKQVTGEDAAYSLMRAWKPTGQPTWSMYFSAVQSIRATGSRQVTVTLSHPDLLFQQIMSTAAGDVIEKAPAQAAGGKLGAPQAPPMCSGPYKFVRWRPGADLTIERNDNYWRGVTAKTTRITFTFLQGDAATSTALVGGAIQGMYNPPWSALKLLPQHGKLYDGKSLLTFYLVPTGKKGPLQDPRIRRALFLALDRAGVARIVFNGGARASTTLLPRDSYGDVTPTASADTGGSASDLAEAKRLVAQAGSPKQTIILAGTTGISDTLPQTLEALVQAGNEIGLNMRYESVTLDRFYAFFSPGGWKASNADGFGSQWNLPVADPMSMYSIWSDRNDVLNYGGFGDPVATKLIDQAAADGNPSSRAATLAAVDKQLAPEIPWIPVVDVANVLFLANNLSGPPASQTNWFSPWASQLGSMR